MRKYLLLLVIAILMTACGKRGALIYPDMLTPAAPSDVKADQLGPEVELSFQLPQKDQAGRALNNLAGVDVFKKSASSGQPPGCSACVVDYALFKKIYLNLPGSGIVRNGSQMVLLDGDVKSGRDYSYYIIPFAGDAVAGKPSAPVTIGVSEPPLPPRLKVIAEPTQIRLFMTPPPANKTAVAGYNLYRAEKGQPLTIFPRNKELIKGNSYTDIGLKRGTSYIYAVRTVVKKTDRSLAESVLSNQVETELSEE